MRRIIYIILGSLLILALIIGLWWWFFGHSGTTGTPPNLFDSGGTRTDGTGNGGTGGNGQGPIGNNTGTGVTDGTGGDGTGGDGGSSGGGTGGDGTSGGGTGGTGTGGGTQPGNNIYTPGTITPGTISGGGIDFGTGFVFSTTSNIIWNDNFVFNPTTFPGLANTIFFNPTDINDFNTDTVTGKPYITKVVGADGEEIDLGDTVRAFAVAIGGCLAQYALSVGPSAGNGVMAGLLTGGALKVQTNDTGAQINSTTETISQCLVRTIGKVAVQAITDSIVNWINSGFQGKPAFVENFQQFFADVGDQAAGEFLQGSSFAFLCSPIQAQVRIALAQSYARRNNAPSCTLTDATNNVGGFLQGGFGQDGWRNLISYTTEPANNPFGAYQTLEGNLHASIDAKVGNKRFEVDLGQGFLSYEQCDPVAAGAGAPLNARSGKNCKIVTPGTAIDSALTTAFGQSVQSLQVGDSFMQIITALENALVTKALYGGLSNLNEDTGASNTDSAAQQAATVLMNEMQVSVKAAQTYGTTEQRIITDVQTAQQNAVDLQNCWLIASTSPTLTTAQHATVDSGISSAAGRLLQLEAYITTYNQNIQRANNSIVSIQGLQTDVLVSNTAADVTAVRAAWTRVKAGTSPHVYTATDVTTAQQDRTSMQSSLASINIDTSAKLQQCHAIAQ